MTRGHYQLPAINYQLTLTIHGGQLIMKQEEIDMLAHAKRGVLTLCLGHTTGENIIVSLAVTEQIAKTLNRGKVLYLNTAQSGRQLATEIRKKIQSDYS